MAFTSDFGSVPTSVGSGFARSDGFSFANPSSQHHHQHALAASPCDNPLNRGLSTRDCFAANDVRRFSRRAFQKKTSFTWNGLSAGAPKEQPVAPSWKFHFGANDATQAAPPPAAPPVFGGFLPPTPALETTTKTRFGSPANPPFAFHQKKPEGIPFAAAAVNNGTLQPNPSANPFFAQTGGATEKANDTTVPLFGPAAGTNTTITPGINTTGWNPPPSAFGGNRTSSSLFAVGRDAQSFFGIPRGCFADPPGPQNNFGYSPVTFGDPPSISWMRPPANEQRSTTTGSSAQPPLPSAWHVVPGTCGEVMAPPSSLPFVFRPTPTTFTFPTVPAPALPSAEPLTQETKQPDTPDSTGSSSPAAFPSPPPLVASPDKDPYGSGGYGAGLVATTVSAVLGTSANPSSSTSGNDLALRVTPSLALAGTGGSRASAFVHRAGGRQTRSLMVATHDRSRKTTSPVRNANERIAMNRAVERQADAFGFKSSLFTPMSTASVETEAEAVVVAVAAVEEAVQQQEELAVDEQNSLDDYDL